MSQSSRLGHSWSLARHAIAVVWNDKSLLFFPTVSTACTMFVMWLFVLSVGPAKYELLVNTEITSHGDQILNRGWYEAILIAYLALSYIAIFFGVALVGAAHISMTERDSVFRDGVSAALRNIVSLTVWTIVTNIVGLFSLLSFMIGFVLYLFSWNDRVARVSRRVFGATWSNITFLVLPDVVVGNRTIFTAIPRSGKLIQQRWGQTTGRGPGLGWFFLLLNIPYWVLLFLLWYTQDPAELPGHIDPYWGSNLIYGGLTRPFVFLYLIGYLPATFILVQTLKSIITVVLYRFAVDGTPLRGWEHDALEHAFTVVEPPAATTPSPESPAPDPLPEEPTNTDV